MSAISNSRQGDTDEFSQQKDDEKTPSTRVVEDKEILA